MQYRIGPPMRQQSASQGTVVDSRQSNSKQQLIEGTIDGPGTPDLERAVALLVGFAVALD